MTDETQPATADQPASKPRSRSKAAAAPFGEPTAPRARDAEGRELDAHGLPLSGPARRRLLAEGVQLDPALYPEGGNDAGDGTREKDA